MQQVQKIQKIQKNSQVPHPTKYSSGSGFVPPSPPLGSPNPSLAHDCSHSIMNANMNTNKPQKKKSNRRSSQSKPKKMVWNKRRSPQANSRAGVKEHHVNLRSCLKKDIDSNHHDYSNHSTQSSQSQSSSRRAQSIETRSDNSQSSGSTSGTQRCKETSSQQNSCTSHSSASPGALSKASRAGASENSDKSRQSKEEKAVRFEQVHIRLYERVVGDNPSCSNGPPIGIGWAHGDTRVVNVDQYEDAKPYRRTQTSLVLTRDEREEILLRWGTSFDAIIDAIRANIKAKNQRRQTVTNLGKVERLEEAFESASRKLKRAVLLRKRTKEKVKELQQQADLASRALESLKLAEDKALDEIRCHHAPVAEPISDDLDSLKDIEIVQMSDFRRNSSTELETDAASAVSGFTLGNSTTASVLEMEKFYRELELEMFGDMELPNMVGETLELSGVEIPEEERVYNDPPSVAGGSVDDGSFLVNYPEMHMQIHDMPVEQNGPFRPWVDQEISMLSPSLDNLNVHPHVQRPANDSFEATPYRSYPPHFTQYMQGRDQAQANYHVSDAKLSSSLDTAAINQMMGHQALRSMYELEQQWANGYGHRVPPPPRDGKSKRRRSKHRVSNDGPQIRHIPLPTNLTPTQWMEDSDTPRHHRGYEPITITEDSYERKRHSSRRYHHPYQKQGYQHSYTPPTQFPSSFY